MDMSLFGDGAKASRIMEIIKHAREIAELIKAYNDQDLYERIVHLREEIQTLREENIDLRDKVKSLTEAAVVQADLVRDRTCYYMKDDSQKQHPYCITCWDRDQSSLA